MKEFRTVVIYDNKKKVIAGFDNHQDAEDCGIDYLMKKSVKDFYVELYENNVFIKKMEIEY